MAYTTINKSTDHFNTKLYTGNGSTGNAQTGVGFQPDLTWIKNRSDSNPHCWTDAVRGATKYIESDTTDTEDTNTEFLQSFNSDGFTVGNSGRVNTNGNNYASWNWKANGQGSANTTGTINSSYTSANTTSGFSIVTYTGTGTAGTIGHGLGAVPTMIITKSLNYAEGWYCYHVGLGNGASIVLNTTGISYGSSNWNNTTPTSSVFSVGTGDTNTSGRTYVAYCFADKTGFTAFPISGSRPSFVFSLARAATIFAFTNLQHIGLSLKAFITKQAGHFNTSFTAFTRAIFATTFFKNTWSDAKRFLASLASSIRFHRKIDYSISYILQPHIL